MSPMQSQSPKPQTLTTETFPLPSEEGSVHTLSLSLQQKGKTFAIELVGQAIMREVYRPADRPADVEARWEAFCQSQPPREYRVVNETIDLPSADANSAPRFFEELVRGLRAELPHWKAPFGKEYGAFVDALKVAARGEQPQVIL